MISVEDAFSIVLENCSLAPKEYIDLDNARGRTLAEAINAERNFPPFDRVTMDGIAINFSTFEGGQRAYKIAGTAAAGAEEMTLKNESDCLEVMTGAMLPVNCDTVIRYEDLNISDGKAVITVEGINFRQNVHFEGSDRKASSLLMDAGKVIGAPELAVLATCGKSKVVVYKTPKIAIVSSGDELVEVSQKPLPHQIRRSNNYSIYGALAQFNCEVESFHLLDDPVEIKSALTDILRDFDIVILSGGVSMGKFDYIPSALEALGVQKLFHKVAQRPGKPFWFGKAENGKTVFALPGNPVSSFMCTNRYVLSWMKKHLGIEEKIQYAELDADINFKPNLTYFAQVKLTSSTNGKVLATPIEGNGSGDLANLTDADAFMSLPQGQNLYKKGGVYQILKYSLIFVLLFFIQKTGIGQEFKTVGYLPYYRFSLVEEINFEQVTHVNISFGNPDMQGNLSVGERDIKPVVEVAKNAGAKVYIALAGGALIPEWAAAWKHNMKAENRSTFIHKILQYTFENDLDGIDMDLEWSHVDEHYSPFVIELADSIRKYDLGFTAALPGTYRYPQISNEALDVFDWVNMMAYDLRGGWDPGNAGPHSPYSFAVASMNYWLNQGVEGERLTLGVPFYGYDFSDPSKTTALTYNQIIAIDEDNAVNDQFGNIYYNGMPTIEQKTELAMAELSGVMIWELGQDHMGEYSLLRVIHSTINGASANTVDSQLAGTNIYPNPFQDRISVEFAKRLSNINLSLRAIDGKLLRETSFERTKYIDLNVEDLGPGSYVLTLSSEEEIWSKLVLK